MLFWAAEGISFSCVTRERGDLAGKVAEGGFVVQFGIFCHLSDVDIQLCRSTVVPKSVEPSEKVP